MARKGILMDITELFPKTAPELYAKYSKDELRSMKVDNKLFTIPSLMASAYCTNVWVKPEFMRTYKLPPIKTLDDYTLFLKTVKENEPGFVPGSIDWVSTEAYARLFGYVTLDNNQGLVYKWTDPDMKVIPWEQTPEFKEVVTHIANWRKNGYLPSPNDNIAQEQMASMLSGSDGTNKEETMKVTRGDGKTIKEYEMYRYHLYRGVPIQRTSPVGNIFMNGAIAFNAKSPNVERALQFLEWVHKSQENHDLLQYGIEGTHYVLKDGILDLPEGTKHEDNKYLGWSGSTAFRDMKFLHTPRGIEGDLQKDYIEFIQNQTRYAPHEGFYPDYTSIQDLARKRAENINSKISGALFNGTFDPSSIDALIEEFKQAGSSRIVEEVQKQLNGWKTKNK
jgi:putative aldouronate transport system substrate-binding protein